MILTYLSSSTSTWGLRSVLVFWTILAWTFALLAFTVLFLFSPARAKTMLAAVCLVKSAK